MRQLNKIQATDLQAWLAEQPATVRVLSLDCFDTIVWRRVAQPADVFFALQESDSWRAHGIRAAHRAKAESNARARKHLLQGWSEVSIDEIYRELLPAASDAERAACIADEMSEEIRHAYLFAPMLETIRQARGRGMKVMVVSDTYWNHKQLAYMLSQLAGSNELDHLRLHCSCEYGVSKAGGIWPHVLKADKLQAHQLVHLGDNEVADGHAPSQHGIRSAQLVQHDEDTASALRSYASAASQLMPELRHALPLPSLFHGQLAMWSMPDPTPAQRIGYRSMGPIMYAFARYLASRLQALEAKDRPVRVAFLMRDGHLPMRAFSALYPQVPVAELRISRFTANAASFRGRDEVVGLLAAGVDESNAAAILKQLLFTPQEAAEIMQAARQSGRFSRELSRQVLRDDQLRKVLARSAAFRERLYAHVQSQTGVRAGETLVLVDLGYSGTVQTRLRHLFRQDLGVELRGMYLLLSAAEANLSDREGLIEPAWADERMVVALTSFIGLFEMMCTRAEPPTIDYTPDGQALFGSQGTKGQQSLVAQAIQDASLAFVTDVSALPEACRPKEDLPALARQAAGELGRLTYFPQPDEIACLSAFEFDFNLGTDLVLATADLEAGAREYRREGFAMMTRSFTDLRVSYPMEMRHLDLSLATLLLSAKRFGYGIRPQEMSYRRLTIPVLAANERSHALQDMEAVATHDGYYSLHLPLSASFDVSALIGEAFEWIQIDSVEVMVAGHDRTTHVLKLGEDVILDGATKAGESLFNLSPQSLLFVPRSVDETDQASLVRLVFRPVVFRPSQVSSAELSPR